MLRQSRLLRGILLSLLFLPLIFLAAACVNPADSAAAPGNGSDYLFCFWNMENFFDDKADGRKSSPDKEYDEWFAHDKAALDKKLDHLSSALMKMNDGKGPDILAGAEFESERSAELLMNALNAKINHPELKYKHILFKDPHGGRNIATAIITRLDVDKSRTHSLGKRQRILEGHITVGGHDLVVLATHWTSRVSDQEGEGRDKYADQVYGRYRGMHKSNPKVAFLVCGDFNDPPDDESVTKHLHAIGDMDKVKAAGDPPLMFNVFGDKKYFDGSRGSISYKNKWSTFDQIAVSPAMLDGDGWICETSTARIVNDLTADKKGHPFRFGSERDKGERGWSDHFPVTVRLKVNGK